VATDAATAADAISATNPYTVAFLLHPRRSQIQTTDNEELSNGVGGGDINIPLNPQNHRYLLLSQHNINIFSLSTSCSSSPCFLSTNKIAHQINQETPNKKKKQLKPK
jgi:hypothetical protein